MQIADKLAVIESLSGASVRQAEKKLAEQFPQAQVSVEKIKPISESRTKIELSCSNELVAKLEKLKHLLAHKNFDGRLEGVMDAIADIALEKLDPERRQASRPATKPASSKISPQRQVSVAQRKEYTKVAKTENLQATTGIARSRYISTEAKRKVWIRAQSQCEYMSRMGKRCQGKHGLQIDHMISHSRGGSNDFNNLQLLCGAHNRWKFEQERL
jgi:5-methylcytosine-specific restriction endonuclease McrA/cell fate (sporulation/competence/biofilm development) regulator YlbF (YheA/YmcA/DUF963 family)